MKTVSVLSISFLVFTSMALSWSAQAGMLQCSSANQNQLYQVSTYSGGPAPFPGQELSRETLVIGNLLSQERVHYEGGSSSGNWTAQVNLVEKHILRSERRPWGQVKDFAAVLQVKEPSLSFKGEFFMICNQSETFAP